MPNLLDRAAKLLELSQWAQSPEYLRWIADYKKGKWEVIPKRVVMKLDLDDLTANYLDRAAKVSKLSKSKIVEAMVITYLVQQAMDGDI